MSQNLVFEQKQETSINQYQLQALHILSMTSDELYDFLYEEYETNPLLEKQSKDSNNGSNFIEYIQNKDTSNIFNYFFHQLNSSLYSKEEIKVITFMIQSIENDGLLKTTIEDISKVTGVPLDTCKKCHDLMLTLDPPGVFATTVQECLIIQLKRLNLFNPEIESLITNFLPELAKGYYQVIARHLKISKKKIIQYLEIIKTLDPHPFHIEKLENASYISPDIILVLKNEELMIELNDNYIDSYSISDFYLSKMRTEKDITLKEYYKKKYNRLHWIFSCIEKRRETLTKITETIILYQSDFFKFHNSIKPMSMVEIANKIKIHPSTVSRAIHGKYIQYPLGIISMKSLFSNAYSYNQKEMSVFEIKQTIKSLIQNEDSSHPYSDQQISDILTKNYCKTSRRTVSKYRDELHIPNTYHRLKR